jgi:hypothetical protein
MMKEREMNGTAPSPSPVKKLVTEPVAEEAAVARIGYRHEAYDEILQPEATHAKKVSTGNIEYKFALGLTVAIISGVLSACFNFGLEAGKSMSDVANKIWVTANPGQGEFLYRNNVIYVVLLWGGLTTNLMHVIKHLVIIAIRKHHCYAIIFLRHWRVLPGSFNFSFMEWEKADSVMEPPHGFCTCHSSYWLPTCGD